MPQGSQVSHSAELNATSKMSFAVAACAFSAAGIGLLINQWMTGWMAVGGMAGVGLFYVAIGLLNLGSTSSAIIDESDLVETASHRLSGALNVNDLAVERPEVSIPAARTVDLVKSRN